MRVSAARLHREAYSEMERARESRAVYVAGILGLAPVDVFLETVEHVLDPSADLHRDAARQRDVVR